MTVVAALLDPYVTDWLNLLIRWLHVIAAIAWIGASFYFVLLDQSLESPTKVEDLRDGVGGELWEVHGGGFYHVKKYKVAPPVLPEHLAWFKWEAYTTWLSGFALMVVLYYFNASSYLIDPAVADLTPWQAVGISVGLLVAAWVVYDVLCRLLVGHGVVLWLLIVAFTAVAAWGCAQLFQPRAAFLQVGAMIGTIMAGNVFFNIIPAHWELINAKRAGRDPDPRPGIVAKQRSVHNNYFTLPVLFTMIAGHFAFTYGAGQRLARAPRDHVRRRPLAALLQPAAPGPHHVGDPRPRRGRARRARRRDPPGRRRWRGRRRTGRLLGGRPGDRPALCHLPRAEPHPGRVLQPAGGRSCWRRPSRSRPGRTTSSASSRRRRCRSATSPA